MFDELCAGPIGWRALNMAGDAQVLGYYGFGASAHLVAQIAVAQKRRVFAFNRPGEVAVQAHALSLGATWAGGSEAVARSRVRRCWCLELALIDLEQLKSRAAT